MAIGNMITDEKDKIGRNNDKRYSFLTTEKRFQDLFREIDQILST